MINVTRRGTDGPTWRWLMMATLCVLTACQPVTATGTTEGASDRTSVDSIHAAFVRALEHNDRSAVVALTVDDQQAVRADTWLRMIASYRDSTATEGSYATGGSLTDVQIDAVEALGAGRQGLSRWIYPRRTICHAAELAQTEAGWRVAAFNTTTEACAREP